MSTQTVTEITNPSGLEMAERTIRRLRNNRIVLRPSQYEEYEQQVHQLESEQRVILRARSEAAADDLIAIATDKMPFMKANCDSLRPRYKIGLADEVVERQRPPVDQISPALFNEAVIRAVRDKSFGIEIDCRRRLTDLQRINSVSLSAEGQTRFGTAFRRHLVEVFLRKGNSRYKISRKRSENAARRVQPAELTESILLDAILHDLAGFVDHALTHGGDHDNIRVWAMLLRQGALVRGFIRANPDGSIQGFEDEPEPEFAICRTDET